MVQRKAPSKLAIQADHGKTDNQIQHQDVKSSIGADLKKKMKKSGTIKRPKQAGKTPAPPLQGQSPVVKAATTPNYMRSTTSSEARKEQSQPQVSTKSPQTSPDKSSLRRKSWENWKLSLSSGKKATKTMARTLTKNPCFKPARASSVRKCAPVVLCENLDVKRATCSSTLKDCKFPVYLRLNPGGTESEGTSAIKVCPYTYCSLNGHHHAPLTPLKCFLSARRRLIKGQRSVKHGCLSPRLVKLTGDDHLSEEENKDFFIEIYSKKDEDAADSAGIEGSPSDYSIIDVLPSFGGGDETAAEDQGERVSEAPSWNDFGACEDFDENGDVESEDTGNTYLSEQNHEVKEDEEVSPHLLVQEETKPEFLNESPVESTPNDHFYEEDSEASDMDWEAGYHSVLLLDYDYEYSPEKDIEPDPEASIDVNRIIKDEVIIKSDGKDWSFDGLWVDEESQESFDEESMDLDAFSSSDDGESTGSNDHLQSSNTVKTAPVEVPEEEQEPVRDEKDQTLFGLPIGNQGEDDCIVVEQETSFDNLNYVSPPNEDAIEVTGEQVSNLESSDENVITLSIRDTGKEPHSEGSPLTSTEAERRISRKITAENAAKQAEEESALSLVIAKFKKPIQESDENGTFNPREPNFLPLEPDPDPEKVDLRHQDLDEKKNSEEWMSDYALRQAVTKLGPARKRKVALLVEAFEKVMPVKKCDHHLRRGSAFDQARPMQACS